VSATPDSALAAVITAWPQVVERVGHNPANKPLIAACRPVEVRDSTIVLGFPESQAFLRDIAERKRATLEAEIGHVLGRAVAVHCVTSNVELVASSAALSAPAGDDLVAHARRVFEDDLVDVAEVD
jgi:hypothetical protein